MYLKAKGQRPRAKGAKAKRQKAKGKRPKAKGNRPLALLGYICAISPHWVSNIFVYIHTRIFLKALWHMYLKTKDQRPKGQKTKGQRPKAKGQRQKAKGQRQQSFSFVRLYM